MTKESFSSEDVRRAFARDAWLENELARLKQEKDSRLADIRGKIRTGHVPTDVEFIAAALLSDAPRERLAYLEEMKEKVAANQGKPVAWVTSGEVITTRRFAGPNDYETHWYLNAGILPPSASLRLDKSDGAFVPVSQALTAELSCASDPGDGGDKPAWLHSRITWISEIQPVGDEFWLPPSGAVDYGVYMGDEVLEVFPKITQGDTGPRFRTALNLPETSHSDQP